MRTTLELEKWCTLKRQGWGGGKWKKNVAPIKNKISGTTKISSTERVMDLDIIKQIRACQLTSFSGAPR